MEYGTMDTMSVRAIYQFDNVYSSHFPLFLVFVPCPIFQVRDSELTIRVPCVSFLSLARKLQEPRKITLVVVTR